MPKCAMLSCGLFWAKDNKNQAYSGKAFYLPPQLLKRIQKGGMYQEQNYHQK